MAHINVTVAIAVLRPSFFLDRAQSPARSPSLVVAFFGARRRLRSLHPMTLIPAGLSLLSHAHHHSPREKKKKMARKDPV